MKKISKAQRKAAMLRQQEEMRFRQAWFICHPPGTQMHRTETNWSSRDGGFATLVGWHHHDGGCPDMLTGDPENYSATFLISSVGIYRIETLKFNDIKRYYNDI